MTDAVVEDALVDTASGAPPGTVLSETAFGTTYARPGKTVPVVPKTVLVQAKGDVVETADATVMDVAEGIVQTE